MAAKVGHIDGGSHRNPLIWKAGHAASFKLNAAVTRLSKYGWEILLCQLIKRHISKVIARIFLCSEEAHRVGQMHGSYGNLLKAGSTVLPTKPLAIEIGLSLYIKRIRDEKIYCRDVNGVWFKRPGSC